MASSIQSTTPEDVHATSARILDIIMEYALHKFSDTEAKLAVGRPKFLETIAHFMKRGEPIDMCLPAFPFKSSNKVYKVLGKLPDKAEELALARLETMCERLQAVYAPGAVLTIISDGLVYNDLLSISDQDTWAYGEALRAMAGRMSLEHIRFARIRDLIRFPGPEILDEISYVANATNFRRSLLNEHGRDDLDIDHEIASNEDTKLTYLGYRRFLESDLKHIFPLGNGRSSNGYKKSVKFLAKEMLVRGYAFAGAVKSAFPEHLRLSIHQSTGEHKISVSLLHTNTAYTTPWHCSVAKLADGTWTSAPKGDFEAQRNMRVMHENGRPSHFQEELPAGQVCVSVGTIDRGAESIESNLSQERLDELQSPRQESMTGKTAADVSKVQTIVSSISSEPQLEKVMNTFLPHSQPGLDPGSEVFDAKAWFKNFVALMTSQHASCARQGLGLSFQDLSVHAFWHPTHYQKTFWNLPLAVLESAKQMMTRRRQSRKDILQDIDGLLRSGEMLLVLGRPGSGCTTLLKTLAGEMDQLHLAERTNINYQGVPHNVMSNELRGEAIYQAETDVHFRQLTVKQTLEFAARARTPQALPPGVGKEAFVSHVRDAYTAMFGLRNVADTQAGDAFVRGVSGGEMKRVSIAEVAIARSAIQCWDNSTRGLDSATALEFVQRLRTTADCAGTTVVVTLYQAPESVYEVFDKVAVLYDGRQIFFGPIGTAKEYFANLGFEPKPRQTTADFLTSVTSLSERHIRPDFRGPVPATAEEFALIWQKSQQRTDLLAEIKAFNLQYPVGGAAQGDTRTALRSIQAKSLQPKSPYTLSLKAQVDLCVWRGFKRLSHDMTILITSVVFNSILSIVVGSVFYNLPDNNSSLYSRGVLLYFAIMLAAFASALEILVLYAQRPIVEKQARYAFCHPFAEAIASMLCDLPNKFFSGLGSALALYFMTNLRRTPGSFFIFLLFTSACTLTMSMYFRCIAALSRTLAQAMAPASVFSLTLVVYTGFAIPPRYMKPWLRWLNYLNPVAYAFESLMINEFHDRDIPCSEYVPRGPGYDDIAAAERICATSGSVAGAETISGDVYLAVNFGYHASHLWRNLGIMIALMTLGCAIYLVASEYITEQKSEGEILLFRRGSYAHEQPRADEESASSGKARITDVVELKAGEKPAADISTPTSIFHWENVSFDIGAKKKTRRILQNVDGWIKPGTLTALMGVSGAGKTTLLNVLADRASIGVISGEMLVDGSPRGPEFRRQTGYAQQQDLHLPSSTVREALTFSALLRQPSTIPHNEKLAYVDEVLQVLGMEAYSEAVIGVPGQGLNVEQRKRLTIAVELVAKPALLLFLDEPTSGLDSQTAWSICTLLRTLADHGQAILCTIHQPSAPLLEMFDRLLYLAPGGRTVYFGDLGASCSAVIRYFESNGARSCGKDENPAEWMLEVTGKPRDPDNEWADIWDSSEQQRTIKTELAMLKQRSASSPHRVTDFADQRMYAAPYNTQLWHVLWRGFQHYWRTPSYLWAKFALCFFSALFIGLSFWKMPNSIQGTQNQLFAIFLLLTIFTNFCQQMMPHAVTRRELAEARELPSKTYSWQAFILSDILVEVPWNSSMAVVVFVCWYYPIGLQQNAIDADQTSERGILMFLFVLMFFNFAGTFASMTLALMDTAESAGNVTGLLFSLSLIFCGVLATPQALPGFWIFMYRVSPLTYLVSGVLSVGLANTRITCAAEELLRFSAPPSMTCLGYLGPYIQSEGGYLVSGNATSSACVFCPASDTNTFLKRFSAEYSDRWRNLGIFSAYVLFNLVATVGLYWIIRVPKRKKTV